MKSFSQYLSERRKTPLSGQAAEEWDEVQTKYLVCIENTKVRN